MTDVRREMTDLVRLTAGSFALVVYLLGTPPGAGAQGLDQAAAAGTRDPAYDGLIASGVAEFERGNWLEARAYFRRAHAVRPSARTLRGLGYVAYELHHYVESMDLLMASLRIRENALEQSQRAQVKQLVDQLQNLIGHYVLSVKPLTATIHVNGEPLAPLVTKLRLSVGKHQLRVSADGYAAQERAVDVLGGEHEALSLDLVPLPSNSPGMDLQVSSRAVALPALVPEGRDREAGAVWESPWFWTTGVLLAAGGVVLGLVLLGQNQDPSPVTPNTGITIATLGVGP